MEAITAVKVFWNKRMSKPEGGRPERVGSHRIDATVIAEVESATLEPQIENFNDTFAYLEKMSQTIEVISRGH